MRKQYHFRPGPRRLRAWDVNRLIELTRHLVPEPVRVSVIRELDEPCWFGAEGDTPTCRAGPEHARLIQEADLRFPVILIENCLGEKLVCTRRRSRLPKF